MSTPRPKLFLGSSSEHKCVAEAIQDNLHVDIDVDIWDQNVIAPSKITLAEIVRVARNYNGAAFIFGPDDMTQSRDQLKPSTRDNVILETGIFIGSLAIDRVFIVSPAGIDIKMPTDLLGVTRAEYSPENPNLASALGAASRKIKQALTSSRTDVRAESTASSKTMNDTQDRRSSALVNKLLTEHLCSLSWELVFRPDQGRKKTIEFSADGHVSAGKNQNECYWRLKNGTLELLRDDRTVHNRYRVATEPTTHFISTNENDCYAIHTHKIPDQRLICPAL